MKTIELTRQISEDEFQFEDTATRRARVLRLSEILNGIYSKKFEIVVAAIETGETLRNNSSGLVLDLSSLTESERRDLDLRYRYVKAMQRARISRGRRDDIAAEIRKIAEKNVEEAPSTSSVMKWMRDYQTNGCNALALVSRYRIARRKKRVHPDLEHMLWDALRQHYFTRSMHSAKHAYALFDREVSKQIRSGAIPVNTPMVSYSSFMRRIKDVDLYHRVATREGPKRAEMVCRTAFPDGVASYPLERIEIDHTPLNWVVTCDRTGLPLGRPILSVMIDSYSNYILGFYVSFYGAGVTSVSGVVRSSLRLKLDSLETYGLSKPWLSHGIGDEWVVDNGLEFHSRVFNKMAMALGVDVMYCKVRTPWLKPHVERFFGSLDFLTLDKGRVRKTVANVVRMDPYKDSTIVFSDLMYGLFKFVVEVHPFEPNWRKMARPFDLFQEGLERCPPAIYPGSTEDLILATGNTQTLTMNQGGVELMGLPYGSYGFKEIAKRNGSKNVVEVKWDPDDMARIYVQDPDMGNWIEAHCRWPDYADGLSWNQHKLIRHYARKELKKKDSVESLMRSKLELHDHWMDSTRGYRRADALKAGRYADYTSSRIRTPQAPAPEYAQNAEQLTQKAAARIVTAIDPIPDAGDIPDFESFAMKAR
jgi:putative transposase